MMMASFLLLRHFAPPPNTNDDIEQSPAQGRITVEGDLEQLMFVSLSCGTSRLRELQG